MGLLLLVLVTVTAMPLQAEQPAIPDSNSPKSPAEWTDEERFAARFLPAARQARLEKAADRERVHESGRRFELQTKIANTGKQTDFIDGSVHPELFLPIELFNDVVIMGYLNENDESRSFLNATIGNWKDFGASRSLEEVVRRNVTVAVQIQRSRRYGASYAPNMNESNEHSYCRVLATALGRVHAELGPADYRAFLHLLYATVASGRVQASLEPPEQMEATLRARVGGCQ